MSSEATKQTSVSNFIHIRACVLYCLSCRGRAGAATKPDKSTKPHNSNTKAQLPASKSKLDCCPNAVETAEGKA